MYRTALYNLHDCPRTKDDVAPSVNAAEVEIPVSTAGTMISMFPHTRWYPVHSGPDVWETTPLTS